MFFIYSPPRFRNGLSKKILEDMDMRGWVMTKPRQIKLVAQTGISDHVRRNVIISRRNMRIFFSEDIREEYLKLLRIEMSKEH